MSRRLLYHRDLDDSVGTYVTDYLVAIATFPMMIYLLVKMYKSKVRDISIVTTPTGSPVTLMTYAVMTYAASMTYMAVLAGVAHQTLQTAVNYETWRDDAKYLIIWKIGTTFISPALFSLLCMTDKIIEQETNICVPIRLRKIYYVISAIISLSVLAYNFYHMFTSLDPFSIKNLFLVFFAVLGIYGFTTFFVMVYRLCSCHRSTNKALKLNKRARATIDATTKPSSVLKIAACKCSGYWSSNQSVSLITTDLFLHVLAPWIFIAGGVTNFMLRSKCSDSHDAFRLKGCPLPNAFNHNALFHVMYAIALVLLLLAEICAINRRNKDFQNTSEKATTSLLNKTKTLDGAENTNSEFSV